MFKKLSQIQTYRQYVNYLNKLTEKKQEYKEAYEREANNFYSNLKVVLSPASLLNSKKSSVDATNQATKKIWDNYNKENKNYIAYTQYENYIENLQEFVENILQNSFTQTNKYWINLFTKILNKATGKTWKAVNISAKVSAPYSREDSTQTENYICLINEDTDLSSITLKQLETQYKLYAINTFKHDYEMKNNVLKSENKDLPNLIVYDKTTLNSNYIRYPKTFEYQPESYIVVHKIPSSRRYKCLNIGVYNEMWKNVLAKADEFDKMLADQNFETEQNEELE